MLFFFFLPSLLLLLASCSRPLDTWLLASLAFRLDEVEENGLRPFPLGLEREGCSLDREEEEEEESSSGSSSRDWELPGNWDSSELVEEVLCMGRGEG